MNLLFQNKEPVDPNSKQGKWQKAIEKEFNARYKHSLEEMQRVLEENKNTIEDTREGIKKMEDMLQKMRDMQSDLDEKMMNLRAEASLRKVDIDRLFGSLNTITGKGKEAVQGMMKTLENKIEAALPLESCLRPVPKTKEQLTKERHGKTRGARKSWLPMQ